MSYKMNKEQFIAATQEKIPFYTHEKFPTVVEKFLIFKEKMNQLQKLMPKLNLDIIDELMMNLVMHMKQFTRVSEIKPTIEGNISNSLVMANQINDCLVSFIGLMEQTFKVSVAEVEREECQKNNNVHIVEVSSDEEERETLNFAKKLNINIRIVRTDYQEPEPKTKQEEGPVKLKLSDLLKEPEKPYDNGQVDTQSIITPNSTAGRLIIEACKLIKPRAADRRQFAAQVEMFTIAVEKGFNQDTGILEMLRAHELISLRLSNYLDRDNMFIMHFTPKGVEWCLDNYYDNLSLEDKL